jgi:hypothetical protein
MIETPDGPQIPDLAVEGHFRLAHRRRVVAWPLFQNGRLVANLLHWLRLLCHDDTHC